MQRCTIIGILDSGIASLSQQAMQRMKGAQLVIGSTNALQLCQQSLNKDCITKDFTGRLSDAIDWIRDALNDGLHCVVLASGDPLCHGIAGYLASRLCVDRLEVLPNVSTIQLACARLCLPWQQLIICSIHTKDCGDWQASSGPEHGLYQLHQALSDDRPIAVLTSPDNSPDRIARLLVATEQDEEYQMAIAEHLERETEQLISNIPIKQLTHRRFASPNVVLLWRSQPKPQPQIFGYEDTHYQQRFPERGLITKRDVRAITLARLKLKITSIVWDIGAGSGSVGLEAARLCPKGFVYAIEKNEQDVINARANKRQLSVFNYQVEQGKAPAQIDQWPNPDAVFIGGSGGELDQLIRYTSSRLNPEGSLVLNFATIENLSTALHTLRDVGLEAQVSQVHISHSKPILNMTRFSPDNPVWIVSASRRDKSPQATENIV